MTVDQQTIDDGARPAELVAVAPGRTEAPPRWQWDSAFHVAAAVVAGGAA